MPEVQLQPPQIISLAAGAAAINDMESMTMNGLMDPNSSAETFATMVLNYRTLGELQFFVGYEIDYDTRNIFMNTPRYRTLDRQALIANAGRTILCRLVRYEDKDLGVREPEGLTMPIYDRFFLLDVLQSVEELGEITAIQTQGDLAANVLAVSPAVVAAQVAVEMGNVMADIAAMPVFGAQSGGSEFREILETPSPLAGASGGIGGGLGGGLGVALGGGLGSGPRGGAPRPRGPRGRPPGGRRWGL